MPKMSLLDMTQNILNAMEDDEVNSISDTVSSLAVAQVCIDCYYELVDELSLPGSNQLVELEAVSDVDHPNYLKLPDNFTKMWWFKYNDQEVRYLSPWEFLRHLEKRDTGVEITDFGGVKLKIDNFNQPLFWTSFDDTYLVLDSWDSNVDSTLQQSKSAAFCEVENKWEMNDSEIPNLPNRLFPTLLSKAKARCFVNFKQVSNVKEDQSERRGLVRHQNDWIRTNGPKPMDRLPNYARTGRATRKRTPQRPETSF